MAGAGQGASVADQDPLAIRRGLRCAVEAEVSLAEAARRTDLPGRAGVGSRSAGTVRAGTVPSRLRGSRLLRMTLDPAVSSAPGRPGVLGHLRWHARWHRRLLPEIEAGLLARKAYAAAGDADTSRLAEDLGTFVHVLAHHLGHELPTLGRLRPAEARLVRRGQARLSAAARALLHDAVGGCSGRGGRCTARAEELLALLSLQVRDERLILHGATSGASPRRWSR